MRVRAACTDGVPARLRSRSSSGIAFIRVRRRRSGRRRRADEGDAGPLRQQRVGCADRGRAKKKAALREDCGLRISPDANVAAPAYFTDAPGPVAHLLASQCAPGSAIMKHGDAWCDARACSRLWSRSFCARSGIWFAFGPLAE